MDERVPVHRDAPASSSRESASEPRGKVVSGKNSIKPHFPKDRNCDICMRTKITRAPCRKRTGQGEEQNRRLFWRHTKTKGKSTLLHWWTYVIKKCGVRAEISDVQGSSRASRTHLKISDSGAHGVFTEQGSSASQMTAAKVMDVIARLPGCEGQAAVPAYTQVKMEDALTLLKMPKSECADMWILPPKHNWPKLWSSMEDSVVPLEPNLYGHPCYGKGNLRKSYWSMVGRRVPIGNAYSYTAKRDYSFLCMWMTSNWLERNKNIDPMWKVPNKEVDLGEPTSFLDHVYLGCTQRQCEISKDVVDNYRTMFESRISAGATEKIPCSEIFMFLRGPTIWKVMPRSVWNDIVSYQIRRLNNPTKYLLPASMTTTLKEEEMKSVGELSHVCSQIVLKCLKLCWNACTMHELVDLISYGQWINLHDRLQNGPKLVTNAWIDWLLTVGKQDDHSSKDPGRSKIAQNSKVRISGFTDTQRVRKLSLNCLFASRNNI